ncbi:MAG TPA: hypothetical protein VEC57_05490 [Candidatus Limnocylindrales bacterium]|nr:hypothetical protein [Candidatus Limnocylindrales bacterium]
MSRRCRASERGAALLVTILLTAAGASLASAAVTRAAVLAGELRARQDVLCARYAALGGLALDAPTADASAAAALIGPRVGSLEVRLVRRGPNWCVLRAAATCGQAVRTIERTLADPARCS